jgi:hypothetical protein
MKTVRESARFIRQRNDATLGIILPPPSNLGIDCEGGEPR